MMRFMVIWWGGGDDELCRQFIKSSNSGRMAEEESGKRQKAKVYESGLIASHKNSGHADALLCPSLMTGSIRNP